MSRGADDFDESYDVVVVGSGGGGLAAALTARSSGADVLLAEKRDLVGGSTAMSGGFVWVPGNPDMRAVGMADGPEQALAYFASSVPEANAGSSAQRREAFVTTGPEMVDFLRGLGLQLDSCPDVADLHSDLPGGSRGGRTMEAPPYDARRLGAWETKLQPGMTSSSGMAIRTTELFSVQQWNRSLRAALVTLRVRARTVVAHLRGLSLVCNGAALVGRLLEIALREGVVVRTQAALHDLVVVDGMVRGVVLDQGGRHRRIEARNGVVLAAGGFAHNASMRAAYGGSQPNTAQWSIANPGDTGEVLRTVMSLGAQTDLLDEAWWLPVAEDRGAGLVSGARQRPGTILVDGSGRRFVNEAASKMVVGKAMYERDREAQAVPCWLVFDESYRRRYPHVLAGRPGRMPAAWLESGAVLRAETLEELAVDCGIDPARLSETVDLFNAAALRGVDSQFHRGESFYDRSNGDRTHRPNPALGPLARAPFYATRVVPSDVGTCGGLVTDEAARVIGSSGAPVPGLYATGNLTASVMGRHYIGRGASIATSMVFGYLAARHATGAAARSRRGP